MIIQRFWNPNDFLQHTLSIARARFRVMGYARSGQHAISHWLHSHVATGLWYNNICGELKSDGNGVDFTLYRYTGDKAQRVLSKREYLEAEIQPYWYAIGLGFEGSYARYQQLFDSLDVNDIPLILVVRDIRNQTASISKHPDIEVDDKFLTEWKANALQALHPDENTIVINYNKWVSFPEYRALLFDTIRERCGFLCDYDDSHSQKMINIGGGSSFTGMRHAGQAHTMGTLQRYQTPEMKAIINTLPPELLEIDRQLFGEMA